ncbi:MAG: hypothetical protein FGM45_05735 [Actinobacteria bacterium]|nr:hypothetical protein [Actinomycetota bacterium]
MTTMPPRRPTPADIELLAFAQQAELAARDLFAAAADNGVGGEHTASVACIAAHHDAASQAISALIGRSAPQARLDSLFVASRNAFLNDDSFATSAWELENTMVATHLSLLSALDGTEGSALVASIVSAEARHAAALAVIAGLSPVSDADAFLTTPADIVALTPEA